MARRSKLRFPKQTPIEKVAKAAEKSSPFRHGNATLAGAMFIGKQVISGDAPE